MAARKRIVTIIVIAVLLVGVALAGLDSLGLNIGGLIDSGPGFGKRLSYEDAAVKLDSSLREVSWREDIVDRVNPVTIEQKSLEDSLPPIGTFPLVVDPREPGAVVVEIFASTEKSGSGTDGWMVEAANDFNAQNKRLSGGRTAKVRLRKIASGTGYQFIGSRTYLPDAFTPSNHLWVRMAAARGVTMTPIREKTVGNIAGIVMKSKVAKALKDQGGSLSVPDIIAAVVQGDMVAGYTNPYASSTGLNFLVTVLATFNTGDESAMLSPEVVSAFEQFQRRVPFVALTTLQMRESVRQDGSLDAFVMEYQTFAKTKELRSGYDFVPFGLPHDNPLYAVGDPGPEKAEALELFAKFLEQPKYADLAKQYGFNPTLSHQAPFAIPSGETLIAAQQIWKERKDAGRPIAAVFLSDVSGSMNGLRLRQLKKALTEGSSFIAVENAIGLVEFSETVRITLPVKPFTPLQRAAFHEAVLRMQASGGTAMYDGIAVALSLLVKEAERNPGVRPMLFVLTDGETNRGLRYGDLDRTIRGLQIPVYTIGFEANIEELSRLSSLVEAASLNASEENLRYQIGSLLNSQM